MESLLVFLAIVIISSLFNGGKRKQQAEQRKGPKPFSAGDPRTQETSQADPMRKLKEMSKELFEDIQKEFEIEQEKPVASSPPVKKEIEVRQARQTAVTPSLQEVPMAAGRKSSREQRREYSRQSRITQQVKVSEKDEKKNLIPSNHDDIMKGIIFSEILAAPKSRR